jgi:Sec-independent protein secretion pathway component TatC
MIVFIVAAVITPTPSVATQSMFAIPMDGLYPVGVVVAWLFGKEPTSD